MASQQVLLRILLLLLLIVVVESGRVESEEEHCGESASAVIACKQGARGWFERSTHSGPVRILEDTKHSKHENQSAGILRNLFDGTCSLCVWTGRLAQVQHVQHGDLEELADSGIAKAESPPRILMTRHIVYVVENAAFRGFTVCYTGVHG